MLDVLKGAISEAGTVLNKHFEFGRRTDSKDKSSHSDIVTSVDHESQSVIRDAIFRLMLEKGIEKGEIGFVGEENLNATGRHMFIIDPIDGTTNFACGLGFFCISIAYALNGEIVSAVVLSPTDNTIYWAEKGAGAFAQRNGNVRRLNMVAVDLRDALVSAHVNSDPIDKALEIYKKLKFVSRGMRALGSVVLELCFLADGIIDVLFNSRCYLWDVAAASLIVRESGGEITDWEGNTWKPDWEKPRAPLQILASHREKQVEVGKFF